MYTLAIIFSTSSTDGQDISPKAEKSKLRFTKIRYHPVIHIYIHIPVSECGSIEACGPLFRPFYPCSIAIFF